MSKKRILIVEDEALTVLALKYELTELGYEIAGDASTAADALRAAEENRADTVGRAVESGAFGYLLKPYTVPELKAAIDIALHKHKSETAMRRALSARLPAGAAQPQSN